MSLSRDSASQTKEEQESLDSLFDDSFDEKESVSPQARQLTSNATTSNNANLISDSFSSSISNPSERRSNPLKNFLLQSRQSLNLILPDNEPKPLPSGQQIFLHTEGRIDDPHSSPTTTNDSNQALANWMLMQEQIQRSQAGLANFMQEKRHNLLAMPTESSTYQTGRNANVGLPSQQLQADAFQEWHPQQAPLPTWSVGGGIQPTTLLQQPQADGKLSPVDNISQQCMLQFPSFLMNPLVPGGLFLALPLSGVQVIDPEEELKAAGRKGTIEPFPERLHRLLLEVERSGQADIISFTPDGKAFEIHKPDRFFQEIIPRYFRQNRLSSFKRQLNLYGFEIVGLGPSHGAYFHPNFLKGRPDLCRTIRRKDSKIQTPNISLSLGTSNLESGQVLSREDIRDVSRPPEILPTAFGT